MQLEAVEVSVPVSGAAITITDEEARRIVTELGRVWMFLRPNRLPALNKLHDVVIEHLG